jgi:hypothetical protein
MIRPISLQEFIIDQQQLNSPSIHPVPHCHGSLTLLGLGISYLMFSLIRSVS